MEDYLEEQEQRAIEKLEIAHLKKEIVETYRKLAEINFKEKSNPSSLIDCFQLIKGYSCRASEMKTEAEDLLLNAKFRLREREAKFQETKSPDMRQYDYRDRKNIFCTLEEAEFERMEFLNKSCDRLRNDIDDISMQLNVLQKYYVKEYESASKVI